MLSKILSKIIDSIPSVTGMFELGGATLTQLEQIDPEVIFPEQVRYLLHVPSALAIWLCDQAVGQGYFVKRIGYFSPDSSQRMLLELPADAQPPREITDRLAEAIEEREVIFTPDECVKRPFYKLVS